MTRAGSISYGRPGHQLGDKLEQRELCFDRIALATVLLMFVQYAPFFGSFMPGGLYLLLGVLGILRLLRSSPRRAARFRRDAPQHG